MELLDVFVAQLSDPFRIGLLVALLATQIRTEAVTGRALPLALGAVFVAAMIPIAMPSGTVGLPAAVLVGLATNALILAVLLVGWTMIRRLRR